MALVQVQTRWGLRFLVAISVVIISFAGCLGANEPALDEPEPVPDEAPTGDCAEELCSGAAANETNAIVAHIVFSDDGPPPPEGVTLADVEGYWRHGPSGQSGRGTFSVPDDGCFVMVDPELGPYYIVADWQGDGYGWIGDAEVNHQGSVLFIDMRLSYREHSFAPQ